MFLSIKNGHKVFNKISSINLCGEYTAYRIKTITFQARLYYNLLLHKEIRQKDKNKTN